jgi:hypothetical protein
MTDLDSLDKRRDTMERDMRVLNEQLGEIKRNCATNAAQRVRPSSLPAW